MIEYHPNSETRMHQFTTERLRCSLLHKPGQVCTSTFLRFILNRAVFMSLLCWNVAHH